MKLIILINLFVMLPILIFAEGNKSELETKQDENQNPFVAPDHGDPPAGYVDPFQPVESKDPAAEFQDPFEPVKREDTQNEHKWNDQIVDLNQEDINKHIIFKGNDWITVEKKVVTLIFSINKKKYNESVNHPDNNRGIILISGDPTSADIYCWMRPFKMTESDAIFIVQLPLDTLDKFHIAYIPSVDKRRFLYKVSSVVAFYKK